MLHKLIEIEDERADLNRQRLQLDQARATLDARICTLNSLVSATLFKALEFMLFNNSR